MGPNGRRGVFKSVTPILKTNKPASSELSALTISRGNARVFDVSHLKSGGAAFYDQFAALTNDSSTVELDQFLGTLRFEFALPDIPVLRELAEERCRAMSLHSLACRNLEDEVWRWAKHGSELTLADIKRACGWFEARGREQRFPMPTDYVRLGGTLINGIVKTITALPDGGVRVLVGAPGSGKSTFLEDFYDDLSKSEVPAIRHHYFVPGADKYDRLKFRDAAEAIVHELERKLPSSLPTTNPLPDKLDEVLASAARMLRANNKSLVLILDGLDHVTRDEDEGELVELLRKVLRRPSGLWIILGTRDFASSSRVARLIEEYAPRDQWLIMPRFDKNGCRNLLAEHRAELRLDNDQHFDEIASAFFSITDGYPLHARYVLTRLTQISNSKSLQASDIQTIPSFGGDVPGLYSEIWKTLPAAAQSIAILLSVAQFELSDDEIAETLRSLGTVDVLNGLEAVRPLTEEGGDGLRFFHSSFAEFVRSSQEYKALSTRLRLELITWLEAAAPEHKRWTWLLRKKAEAGDWEPLVATTTRTWIVHSLCEGRSAEEVISTLEMASSTAMNRDDYARAFSRAQYAIYIENSLRSSEHTWDDFEIFNRRRLTNSAISADVTEDIEFRAQRFLVELARDADSVGDIEVKRFIVDELNERLTMRRSSSHASTRAEDVIGSLMRAAALLRVSIERAVRFVNHINEEYKETSATAFAEELVRSGQDIAFLEFVTSDKLASSIRVAAADAGALSALRRGSAIGGHVPAEGPWMRIHAMLRGEIVEPLPPPPSNGIPEKLADYDREEQANLSRIYEDLFAGAFLYSLLSDSSGASSREHQLPDNWAGEAGALIAAFGRQCGTSVRKRATPDPELIAGFNEIRQLRFGEDRDIWGFRIALHRALRKIFPVAFTILHDYTSLRVDAGWLSSLSCCNTFTADSVSELLKDLPERVLRPDDVSQWLAEQSTRWSAQVEEFPSRAEAFMTLAQVSMLVGDHIKSAELARAVIENLVAYGYHKDMFLLEVIESLDACEQAPDVQRRDWFRRIAPIADSIRSFTDGDETSDFPVRFGVALARYDRFSAFRQYFSFLHDERLYLAEDLFAKLIPFLDLTDRFENAVARTCTDDDSRRQLEKRALAGSTEAANIAEELRKKYGPLAGQITSHRGTEHDQALPDVRNVRPEELRNAIAKVRYSGPRGEFIRTWLAFWMPREPQNAYHALKPWLDSEEPSIFDVKSMIEAIPYVRQFDGPDSAFALLCRAHAAAYGWGRFFVDPSVRDSIFEYIQNSYAEKWRDFIHCTLQNERSGSHAALPVPIGVQYLLRFKRIEEAAELCEAAVKTVEELTGALTFPRLDWLEKPSSALDLLSARLFWISPIVREQVASVVADLLLSKDTTEVIFDHLIDLLETEQLDSKIVVILTPMGRAARLGWSCDLTRVNASVSSSSVPIRVLLRAIARQ